jgi:cytochrome c
MLLAILAAAIAGMGFIHPFGNPRVEPAQGVDTLLVHADISADARKVLINKCADCHSNETRWPVYARLAPGSLLIERDIMQARKKMNLSLWDRMATDDKEQTIREIIHEAKAAEMPPLQYRLLHWNARLTDQEVATLASMQTAELPRADGILPGDPARGKMVFEKRCTSCHALEGNREGPPLGNVFGRKAASVQGFSYSAGLKASGITWNEIELAKWLSDPDTMIPDNKMDVPLPKAQERSDVIAYFKHLTK